MNANATQLKVHILKKVITVVQRILHLILVRQLRYKN